MDVITVLTSAGELLTWLVALDPQESITPSPFANETCFQSRRHHEIAVLRQGESAVITTHNKHTDEDVSGSIVHQSRSPFSLQLCGGMYVSAIWQAGIPFNLLENYRMRPHAPVLPTRRSRLDSLQEPIRMAKEWDFLCKSASHSVQ